MSLLQLSVQQSSTIVGLISTLINHHQQTDTPLSHLRSQPLLHAHSYISQTYNYENMNSKLL